MTRLKTLLDAAAAELADVTGLELARIRAVLGRCLRDRQGRSVSEDTSDEDIYSYPNLPEAMEFMGPERALLLFEKADLDDLLLRLAYTRYWAKPGHFLYRVRELRTHAAGLQSFLQMNVEPLIQTGYPSSILDQHLFLEATWWGQRLKNLYPTKIPAAPIHGFNARGNLCFNFSWTTRNGLLLLVRDHKVLKRPPGVAPDLELAVLCTHNEAPFADGFDADDARRLEQLRPKVLAFKLALANTVRECAAAGIGARVLDKCAALVSSLGEEGLLATDIDFLLRMDDFYAGRLFWGVGAKRVEGRLEPGGITDAMQLIGVYEWTLASWTTEQIREVLDRAKLIVHDPFGFPQLAVESYYQVIGTDRQAPLDAAIDLYIAARDEGERFHTGFKRRTEDLLHHEWPARIDFSAVVPRRLESHGGAYFRFLGKTQIAHLVEFGTLAPMSVQPGGHSGSFNEPTTSEKRDTGSNAFFREAGGSWVLRFKGKTIRPPHQKGLVYIQYLMSRPREAVAAIQLAAIGGASVPQPAHEIAESSEQRAEDGLDQLSPGRVSRIDEAAAAQRLQKRLDHIDEQMATAHEGGEESRFAELQVEYDAVMDEIKSLGGTSRRKLKRSDAEENARNAVAYCINSTRGKIVQDHAELGEHLKAVRTGFDCSYEPETPTDWILTPEE